MSSANFGRSSKFISSHPPTPASQISGKHWNKCKYILVTNRLFFAMENRAQQQARAQINSHIPKWEYLPNWDCVIQTHPLQSTPPHPPWGADKGPICIIKYPEPKYIFSPPKNDPQRAQKRETVSGHLRNAVSHVVDTCLQVPSIPPNSAAPVYLPRPPIRHPRQVNHTTRLPQGPYY